MAVPILHVFDSVAVIGDQQLVMERRASWPLSFRMTISPTGHTDP